MYRSAASDEFGFATPGAPQQWYRAAASSRLTSSSIELDTAADVPAHQDLAISPGQIADDQFLENRRQRNRLKRVVDFFRTHGSYSADDHVSQISETSRIAAVRFIDLLPFNVALPKVAPDGDAGVMLYWSFENGDVVVTVDQNILHCVVGAGTSAAIYYEDLVFEGDAIPEIIVGALQEWLLG